MPRAPHNCARCTTSVPAGVRFCPVHAAEHERRRGTTAQRGYGGGHQRTRGDWEPSVTAGLVDCWRCGRRIVPGELWDLGHDDVDRRRHRGPEHSARCNRAAAGRASH